jgi:hypothetical protein
MNRMSIRFLFLTSHRSSALDDGQGGGLRPCLSVRVLSGRCGPLRRGEQLCAFIREAAVNELFWITTLVVANAEGGLVAEPIPWR